MLEKWRKKRSITALSWMALFFTIFGSLVYGVAFTGQGWAWTLEAATEGWGGEYRSYYSLWYQCSRLTTGDGAQDCRVLEELPTIPGMYKGDRQFETNTVFLFCTVIVRVLRGI